MAKKKILIVDDSPTGLKAASAVLKNYDIITATDGKQALEKAQAEQPDLVVLDVIMPNMDGFQACRKIKKTPELQHIPVIMLTSKNQKSDEFWGKKQGADVYLTKPWDDSVLLKAVGEIIGEG
ncbi:MAG: response regulator [Desulfobacteraceae bacterium]|nr:response regulator [Desulfobacteraceae bacterium]